MWILVSPTDAVKGKVVMNKTVVAVKNESTFKEKSWYCKKTNRRLPAGRYLPVLIK